MTCFYNNSFDVMNKRMFPFTFPSETHKKSLHSMKLEQNKLLNLQKIFSFPQITTMKLKLVNNKIPDTMNYHYNKAFSIPFEDSLYQNSTGSVKTEIFHLLFTMFFYTLRYKEKWYRWMVQICHYSKSLNRYKM